MPTDSPKQVQRLHSVGAHLRTIGSCGSGAGQFLEPSVVAFDAAGHIVVVDQGNDRVQVLRYSDGAHVRTIGAEAVATDNSPAIVAALPSTATGASWWLTPATIACKFSSELPPGSPSTPFTLPPPSLSPLSAFTRDELKHTLFASALGTLVCWHLIKSRNKLRRPTSQRV
jgi:hypothetical protein